MFVLLFLFALFHQSTPTCSQASFIDDFHFANFQPQNCHGGSLICMGSATGKNGYLSLTPDPEDDPKAQFKVGRVLYKRPVFEWPPTSFKTIFTVNMAPFPNSNISADGITFILVPDTRPPPLNSVGGFLGITNTTTEDVFLRQVAVELDTFKNSFTHDISDNHVGIDTTSIVNPIAAKNADPIRLASGNDILVKIEYDFLGKLIVSLAYKPRCPPCPQCRLCPLRWKVVLNQDLALPNIVRRRPVYVGFTASTGLYSGTHRIRSWSFTSTNKSAIDSTLNDGLDHIENTMYEK